MAYFFLPPSDNLTDLKMSSPTLYIKAFTWSSSPFLINSGGTAEPFAIANLFRVFLGEAKVKLSGVHGYLYIMARCSFYNCSICIMHSPFWQRGSLSLSIDWLYPKSKGISRDFNSIETKATFCQKGECVRPCTLWTAHVYSVKVSLYSSLCSTNMDIR